MKQVIEPKPDCNLNNICDTDSYKYSHFLLYPKKMQKMFSYLEARGGEFAECTIALLQVVIHKYLTKPITLADIDVEEKFALEHGEPFNRASWEHIVNAYGGLPPVRIRAIPEGLVVPVQNAVMTIESDDDEVVAWATNYLETQLCRIWYPSSIAIISREIKRVWKYFLELSSDNPAAEIAFKHVDFGSRGVTCREQAALGGVAHLFNFLGSDTVAGIKYANHYYDCPMAGFSIPATEHSTMTIFGREGERAALKTWIEKTLVERQVPTGVPKLSACVGDSYNIYNFVKMVCEEDIRTLIKSSGGTLVVRPDSGNPLEVLPEMLNIFQNSLPAGEIYVNSKGYKVLPDYLRIIWGDGINRRSMKPILQCLVDLGWSVSNIAFGSGGGLLQDVNRDTQKWAFKCSYVDVDGVSVDVRKDPITDPGKRSKAGRLDLIKLPDGTYKTIALEHDQVSHPDSVMVTYYENGKIYYNNTLDEIRIRMAL
jgi:nicotinamide phosphoribosyltransferase